MSAPAQRSKTVLCSLCHEQGQVFYNIKNPILEALQLLKCYAEKTPGRKFHHTVITGKVAQTQISEEWLKASGYTFYKGSGKSNLSFYSKIYQFATCKIQHNIHVNGTWTLQITPKTPRDDPSRFMDFANMVLNSAFGGATSHDIKVKRLEVSRNDNTEILEWMKSQNIKEIKCYVHDKYEARIEVTYWEPPLNPTTAQVLQYCM